MIVQRLSQIFTLILTTYTELIGLRDIVNPE